MNALTKYVETGLRSYDEMCKAIELCHSADEAKAIRGQARAIEVLARQAKNIEAERQCAEIRIRAERRWAQHYRQQEKANPSGANQHKEDVYRDDTHPPTLEELGITRVQSSTWQKLADVGDRDFEKALTLAGTDGVPSTAGVVRNLGHTVDADEQPANPDAEAALWIWGRVNQMVSMIETLTPAKAVRVSDKVMRDDFSRNALAVADWLVDLHKRVK